jgi:hypothetical protein
LRQDALLNFSIAVSGRIRIPDLVRVALLIVLALGKLSKRKGASNGAPFPPQL